MADKTVTLDTIDSTSNYLKEHKELWDANFVSVRAIEQTGGRGRKNRTWFSRAGKDLTFSTLFISGKGIKNISLITVYTGIAIHRVLSRITANLSLKWPNDIYHHNKKLGGILCELVRDSNNFYIIIGIGINVNSIKFPEEIKDRVTSLLSITGNEQNIESIMKDIVEELKLLLLPFHNEMEDPVYKEFLTATSSIGEKITFEHEGKKETGTLQSINRDGSLTILSTSGKDIHYFGEVVFQDTH